MKYIAITQTQMYTHTHASTVTYTHMYTHACTQSHGTHVHVVSLDLHTQLHTANRVVKGIFSFSFTVPPYNAVCFDANRLGKRQTLLCNTSIRRYKNKSAPIGWYKHLTGKLALSHRTIIESVEESIASAQSLTDFQGLRYRWRRYDILLPPHPVPFPFAAMGLRAAQAAWLGKRAEFWQVSVVPRRLNASSVKQNGGSRRMRGLHLTSCDAEHLSQKFQAFFLVLAMRNHHLQNDSPHPAVPSRRAATQAYC